MHAQRKVAGLRERRQRQLVPLLSVPNSLWSGPERIVRAVQNRKCNLSDYRHVQRMLEDSTPDMAIAVGAFTREQVKYARATRVIQATKREVRAG